MTHMTAIVYKYSALSPEVLVNFVALHFISHHTCLQLPVVLARLPRNLLRNLCTTKVFYVNWKLQSPRSRRRSAVVGQFRLTLRTVVSTNISQLIPNHVSPPVVIRWDLPSGKAIRKMTLPAVQKAGSTSAISELLKDCSPATFGHKGQEVLDPSYRRAVKLDSHQFCTNFSPHDFGIIDAIAQTLLPEIAQVSSGTRTEFREHWA